MSTRLLAATTLLVVGVITVTDRHPLWRIIGACMLVFVPALIADHVTSRVSPRVRAAAHRQRESDRFSRIVEGVDVSAAHDPDTYPLELDDRVLAREGIDGSDQGDHETWDDYVWRRRRGF